MSGAGATTNEPLGQSLPSGTRLEEFIIERVLGSGGFGITYLARDSRLGRKVVIKENLPAQFCWRDTTSLTVQPRQSSGEDADNFRYSLESFEKEAATLASLDHPGIVKVLRSFEANGTAYFVMPFVEGMTFDEVIKERQTQGDFFAEEELTGLLWRVLEALSYLHDRGIYHRDIKPGNLLITTGGDPVLIDFGAARQRLSERSLTVIESPGYTPFEQMQSRGKVGPWSDLYALGGTVYKAITGETPAKAADRAFDDPVVPLAQRRELAERYSQRLLQSIDHAMRPKLSERPKSVRDVWEGLNEAEASVATPVAKMAAKLADAKAVVSPAPTTAHSRKSMVLSCIPVVVIGLVLLLATRHKDPAPKESAQAEAGDTAAAARLAQEEVDATTARIAQEKAAAEAKAREMAAQLERERLIKEAEMKKQAAGTDFGTASIGDTRVIDLGDAVKLTLCYCPAGSFVMGSPASEADRGDGENQVQVRISQGFWLGQTEVTQGQWEAVMKTTPAQQKAKGDSYLEVNGVGEDHPMYFVNWEDAQAFIAKLSLCAALPEGWKYALPTEAQWEYACRAGTSTVFGYGESLSSQEANFNGDFPYGGGAKGPNLQKTAVVGGYKANGWGLHDMHGNVFEWCADWYGEKLEGGNDPVGALTGSYRVFRGGSWFDYGNCCRSAFRVRDEPGDRFSFLGFRLAAVREVSADPETAPGVAPMDRPKTKEPINFDGGVVGQSIQIEIDQGEQMIFNFCPAGSFRMGSPPSELARSEDEEQAQVRISQGFWLGQTEVTQGQWAAVMGSNPSEFKGDDLPVESVSWEDAQAFVAKLNQSEALPTGWKYVLPTEAQWEYACRAGTSTAFGFGDSLSSFEANFDGNYPYGNATTGPFLSKTCKVGSYKPNTWGLYDMHGNVYEWCADWYGVILQGGADPMGVSTQAIRVSRGGSWNFGGSNCRSADRNGYDPSSGGSGLGFRVAAVPSGAPSLEKKEDITSLILPNNTSKPKIFAPSLPRTAYTRYPWRFDIVATVFWVGDPKSSPWDPEWLNNFGGIDDPDPAQRTADFTAKGFTPGLNPFYVALPYNDCLSSEEHKPEASRIIPWFKTSFVKAGRTVLRGTWLAIRHEKQVCYAQWENCGPVGADDANYVFGNARPQTEKASGSGIYVSPAVRDYLGMPSWATVDWRFVDVGEIPAGPWSKLGMNNHFVRIKELRDRQQRLLEASRLEELRRQRKQALKDEAK